MAWRLLSDARLIAGGDTVTSEQKRDVVVHTLRGAVITVTPRRESDLELLVDGESVVEGRARCERWGPNFIFDGDGWRLEAK